MRDEKGFDHAALDRHITGNWGENSVDPDCDYCTGTRSVHDSDCQSPEHQVDLQDAADYARESYDEAHW